MSVLGRLQARDAGVELARRIGRVPRIWSSDLLRAAETAGIVAQALGAIVTEDRAFREICLGPWEGRTLAEVQAEDGAALDRWCRDARRPPRRGIEPLNRFADRVEAGVRSLVARARGPVVIVSHGGAISVALSRILDLELRTTFQLPTENGSISRVLAEADRFYVCSFNETGHLRVAQKV